jgi:hypothetical protein
MSHFRRVFLRFFFFLSEGGMEVHLGDVPEAYCHQGAAFFLRPWSSLGYHERYGSQNLITACRLRLKRDGTRAETRFLLSLKRTSPFKSAGASVQSTAGSRGVRISVSNAGYATFRGSMRVLATHSIREFPLHFPSRASPCAIRFQTHSTKI